MRISRKLLLAFLIVSIVPLLLAGYVAHRTNLAYIHTYMGARFQSDSGLSSYALDQYMRTSLREAMAARAALAAAAGDAQSSSRMLAELRRMNPLLLRLRWFDAAGVVHASADPADLGRTLEEERAEVRQLVRTAQDGPAGEALVSEVVEGRSLDIVTSVDDASGRRRGALVVTLGADFVASVLRPYVEQINTESAFVIDRRNRIVFSLSEELRPGTVLAADYAALLDEIAFEGPRKIAARKMLRGAEHYVAVAAMPEYGANRAGGWRFVSVLPMDLVLAGAVMMLAKASIALLVLVIVAFTAAVWLSRSIGRPIVRLTRSAEALAAGDYSARVAPERDVELNQLANAFNRMAEAIAAKTTALETEVAERKAAAEALQRAQLAAEAASRAKSNFLANMSHEIRTPMNGVLGFTNLLLDTALNEEQREYVQTIRHSGESLLHIINDILDFSKVEAGKITVERMPFDLTRAAEEVAELLGPVAEQKHVEVALRASKDAPSNLEGDPGRVRQVLLNLVGNAVKFTRQGHVLIEIDVLPGATPEESGAVRCTVSDTGVGIPFEKQAAPFKEFSQADASTTREFGGTGLGLAISKRLIELMGGRIGFESEPGRGSRFWFSLPAPAHPEIGDAPQPTIRSGEVRLLIVDDIEINQRLLSEQFRLWRFSYECASSGAEALEMLGAARRAGRPFDIALLDFLMPGMDGLELGRRIKSDPALASTSLIMLTSGSQRSAAPTFLAAGFEAFLLKPVVRPSHLLDAIMRVLGSKAAEANVEATSTSERSPALLEAAPTRARVLVAEDNAVNQRLVRHMLEKLGCRVDIAANGLEAVSMSKDLRYDLILMDCYMPEMDGYTATQELRAHEASTGAERTPIVALTANAMPEDRQKCLDVGMDDYLSKPVSKGELQRVVRQWASRGEDALRASA